MTGGAVYILLQGATEELSKKIENLPKAFVPQGTIAFANLPTTPTKEKLGYIWNISDSFTTDDRFIEGSGKSISAGNNVAVIMHENNYYYDVMSQIDLSSYYTKVEVDSKISAEKTAREIEDNTLSNKIDTEIDNRIEADALLQNSLNSEITTRTNADIGLHNEITTEATVRETAINTVNTSIEQEETARTQADLVLQNNINNKQDIISDLDTIRDGASKGATALQEHQSLSAYRKSADQDIIDAEKQDKLIAGTNITIDEDGKTINAPNNAYNSIKQIADYLFEVQYSTENIDYVYANKYFKDLPPTNDEGGACTGIVKDGKVLRQLDWYYDNNAEFVVRRPKDELNGIHASIGIASGIKDITKEIVESGEYNRKFKMIPFIITDGINDAGLYIQSNVVGQLDGGFDLNPTASEECCITMLIRYILDHCASFEDVETVFNTVHIYNTSAVPNYNYHFLLAQNNEWEVIELTSDGHITVTEGAGENQMPHGIMTNFRTTGLTFIDDSVDWSSIEPYGCGVERYDIATRAFTDSRSFDLLRTDLQYTLMYTGATPEWLTELCGETDETYGKLTVMDAVNNPEKFTALMTKDKNAYLNRDRYATNPDTWQTVHSAIYDLSAKSIEVCIQERFNEKFTFKLVEEPDLSNFVTLTGNQDIYDTKTFHSPIVYSTGLNATTLNDKKIVTSGAMSPVITYNLPSASEGEHTLAMEEYVDEKVSTKQDVLIAGNGIKIDNNTISLNSDSSIAIYDNRISDANQWLTNGYTKTSAAIPTANLPDVCTGMDRWGVLLYVAENNTNHAGLQQYFPVDGTYNGRVFYRSVTGYDAETEPDFGEWKLVAWTDEKQDKLTAGTNITIDENNVISATAGGSSYTSEEPIVISDSVIKHKEYSTKDHYAFGIVYWDKYGHITTVNGQEVTGGLLHQANKITVNAGKGLEVDSDSNELKAVGVEYTNGLTTQSNALKFVKLTQDQYDKLGTKDSDTLYMIVG